MMLSVSFSLEITVQLQLGFIFHAKLITEV